MYIHEKKGKGKENDWYLLGSMAREEKVGFSHYISLLEQKEIQEGKLIVL